MNCIEINNKNNKKAENTIVKKYESAEKYNDKQVACASIIP